MITNGGVTIAKEITLSDKMEKYGRGNYESGPKTNELAGDGTTTAVVPG